MRWSVTRATRGRRISPLFLPVLEQLECNAVQYFGKPLPKLEPIHESCGVFSRILHLRVRTGDAALGVFVKRYERKTGSEEEELRFRRYVTREYERTTLARRCTADGGGVVRPIACFPDELALVTEEAAGVPLSRLLTRLAILRTPSMRRGVETAVGRVGTWLRRFQAGVPVVKTHLKQRRDYLDVRLQELVKRGQTIFGEGERQGALAFFDEHAARLTPADVVPVPIHGDLCPSNILVRSDGVTVLDLGMSGDGNRFHDVAHLFMHLHLAGRRLHLGRPLIRRLQRALVEGFEPGFRESQPLFRLMLLESVTCNLATLARREAHPDTLLARRRFRRRQAWCREIVDRETVGPEIAGRPIVENVTGA